MAELRPHVLTLTADDLTLLLQATRLFAQSAAAVAEASPTTNGDVRRLDRALAVLGQEFERHRRGYSPGCCRG